jgi:hypothetical protein
MPEALSPDKKWFVTKHGRPNEGVLLGRGWLGKKIWLVLADRDSYSYRGCNACFSPNGRYLAWGDDRGTVYIADLALLETQVKAFAEDVLPD